jgi:hypothetical protein
VPIQQNPLDLLKKVELPVLMTEVFMRLQEGWLASRTPALNGNVQYAPAPAPVQAPPPRVVQPYVAPKPTLPKVAVVGLLRDQFQFVIEKCKEMAVELVWVDKDQNSPTYPSVNGVIVQRHSRHHWYNVAKATFDPNLVLFADGGIATVVQKVYDFLSRWNAQSTRAKVGV